MKHNLSVTSLIEVTPDALEHRSALRVIPAETALGPFPQFHPESFEGKLVDVSDEELCALKFERGIVAGLEGVGYVFETVEKDGTFKLRKRVSVEATV